MHIHVHDSQSNTHGSSWRFDGWKFCLAFRSFIAWRGTTREVVSDNAKHFRVFSSVSRHFKAKESIGLKIVDKFTSEGITWKFICPLSPWIRGFYERLIGIVKTALKKAIGSLILTADQLHTTVVEIENIVNSRPSTYVREEDAGFNILTPSNLIYVHPETGIFDVEQKDFKEEYIKMRQNKA